MYNNEDSVSFSRKHDEMKLLNLVIDNHFYKNRVSDERLRVSEELRQMLEEKLRSQESFGIQSRVEIFGSLVTGLGTINSDIDISLRFQEDQRLFLRAEQKNIIIHLKKILMSIGCIHVTPIPTAKVPITKFEWYSKTGIKMDADVSFYNVLALHNTRLLKKYCEWEPERLPKMAIFIKTWAQNLGIGSSVNGSLSSYAHSIMVIYYLQNVEPPVLPKLQKFSTAEKAKEKVDGWNVEFLKTVIPNWSSNTSSVAELLIGFFQFYSEFPFEDKVIRIRSPSKYEKSTDLPSSDIMIEDPFNLSRNLGVGVDSEMSSYIKKALSTTYCLLSNFPSTLLNDQKQLDSDSLNTIEAQIFQMCKPRETAPVKQRGFKKNNSKVMNATLPARYPQFITAPAIPESSIQYVHQYHEQSFPIHTIPVPPSLYVQPQMHDSFYPTNFQPILMNATDVPNYSYSEDVSYSLSQYEHLPIAPSSNYIYNPAYSQPMMNQSDKKRNRGAQSKPSKKKAERKDVGPNIYSLEDFPSLN